jgi:hypothetical protein
LLLHFVVLLLQNGFGGDRAIKPFQSVHHTSDSTLEETTEDNNARTGRECVITEASIPRLQYRSMRPLHS